MKFVTGVKKTFVSLEVLILQLMYFSPQDRSSMLEPNEFRQCLVSLGYNVGIDESVCRIFLM